MKSRENLKLSFIIIYTFLLLAPLFLALELLGLWILYLLTGKGPEMTLVYLKIIFIVQPLFTVYVIHKSEKKKGITSTAKLYKQTIANHKIVSILISLIVIVIFFFLFVIDNQDRFLYYPNHSEETETWVTNLDKYEKVNSPPLN